MAEKHGYYKTTSIFNEAIRSVRTNIQFSDIDNNKRVIAMTSSKPSEGKTTVLYSIAKSFAENGDKVILLDCDLRKPSISTISGVENNLGLTNFLTGKVYLADAISTDDEQENLDLMLTGPIPPNPAEVLASNAFKSLVEELSSAYDYIFIDTPPVGLFTDASVVSTLSDGVIFTIKSNDTKREDISVALDNLNKVNAHILGTVLTHVPMKKKKYGNYY